MKITVTDFDIRTGNRKICDACPVALAIKRRFSPYTTVRVRFGYVEIAPTEKDVPTVFKLSRKAMEFISNFDAYGPSVVKPFFFNLPYPH